MEETTKRVVDENTALDPREVWLYSDGVYRWAYEKDLYRNRFEINYLIRIVLLVFGLTFVLLAGTFLAAGLDNAGGAFAIVAGICLGGGLLTAGIVLLVQRISARSRGGVDVVGFEMDESGLRQIRSEKAEKVDRALERMTAVSGLASRNGYAAMQSSQIVADTHPDIKSYADVRRVAVHPRYDVIDVTLKGNYKCRVYARGEDLNFVRDYIVARAPGNITVR